MKTSPPRVDAAERELLRRRRELLAVPANLIEILGRYLGGEPPREASCGLEDESPDRFVLRVEARWGPGVRRVYAFKVYADDRGARLWSIAQALREYERRRGAAAPLCLPVFYVPAHGLAVYPWVHGTALRDAMRSGDIELVGHAAARVPATLARVHRAPVPAEAPRTARAVAARAHHRCVRFGRWPDAESLVRPLLAAIEEALPSLEPSPACFLHGDPGPANLLFDGQRWTLIDMDRCGYGDPACDVGYLLAQLTRRGLEQPVVAAQLSQTVGVLEAAYRAEMPHVSARNIAFYYANTLAQKLIMTWREHPADPLAAIRPLAERAVAALRSRTEGLACAS